MGSLGDNDGRTQRRETIRTQPSSRDTRSEEALVVEGETSVNPNLSWNFRWIGLERYDENSEGGRVIYVYGTRKT